MTSRPVTESDVADETVCGACGVLFAVGMRIYLRPLSEDVDEVVCARCAATGRRAR